MVAPQITRLQERRTDGDVLLGETHAFRERARRVTDLQSQIPQHVQDEFDDALAPGSLRLNGAHEQQIDIGAGQRVDRVPVTARSHHGNALGLGRDLRVVEMLAGEVVEHLQQHVLHIRQRARGDRRPAWRAGLDALLHTFACGKECRS